MELPAIDLAVLQLPGYYDATLVGAGVVGTLSLIVGWINIKPRWENRKMRAEREKVTNTIVASDLLWSLRHMIKDKHITVEEGEMYFWRFANLVPLKEMVKDTTFKTIKEALLEKHTAEKEEEPVAKVVEKPSAFARMSARLKPATA